MLLEQLRRSWYDSSPAYVRVAITLHILITIDFCMQDLNNYVQYIHDASFMQKIVALNKLL
jgi:hypothetical protein